MIESLYLHSIKHFTVNWYFKVNFSFFSRQKNFGSKFSNAEQCFFFQFYNFLLKWTISKNFYSIIVIQYSLLFHRKYYSRIRRHDQILIGRDAVCKPDLRLHQQTSDMSRRLKAILGCRRFVCPSSSFVDIFMP